MKYNTAADILLIQYRIISIMGLSSSRLPPANLNSPQAKLIQKLISENCVVVFSKTTCPYCVQAKQILNGMNIKYEAVELNHRTDGLEIQGVLREMTNAQTVSITDGRTRDSE